MKKSIIIFFCIFFHVELFSLPLRQHDTLRIKANSHFLIDSVYINFLRDTIIVTKEWQIVKEIDGEEYFYGNIRQKTNTTSIGRELAKIAFGYEEDQRKKIETEKDFSKSIDNFENYSGLIVKSIHIKTLDLIESSIYDTTTSEIQNSKTIRFINNFHRTTSESVIHSHLLFKEGDSLNPHILAENERIIRNLNYIDNALFYINPIGDSAEVLLIVKDKFSYGLNFNIISSERQNLKLWNSNAFGSGNEFGVKVDHNQNYHSKLFLSEAYIKVNNFRKDFVTTDLRYKKSPESKSFTFSSLRNYIPSVINLGGGINFEIKDYILPKWTSLKEIGKEARYYLANAWVGYQIQLRKTKNTICQKTKNPKFIIPAIGIYNKYYDKRPTVTADTNIFLSNYSSIYTSFSFVSQTHVNTFALLDQGHVLTLPTGFSSTLTTGYLISEFLSMPYFGVEFKMADVSKYSSYFVSRLQFGTYIHNKKMTNGMLKFAVAHYSPKVDINNYKLRFLTTISYTLGINRKLYDSLYLNDDFGFLGLDTRRFRGEHRLNGMLQILCYTPWKFIGFRFTPFVSLNGGFIANEKQALFKKRFVSGYGIGVRLYNKYLVFANIQLRLMYYPNMPSGVKAWAFDLLDTDDYLLNNFMPKEPYPFVFE